VAKPAVGAYATPKLHVDVQGGVWNHDDNGDSKSVYRAGLVAQFRPQAGSGLHLADRRGVVGLSSGRIRL
jgi:hypothetical protein